MFYWLPRLGQETPAAFFLSIGCLSSQLSCTEYMHAILQCQIWTGEKKKLSSIKKVADAVPGAGFGSFITT